MKCNGAAMITTQARFHRAQLSRAPSFHADFDKNRTFAGP
jgi:hypothetical protein